MKTLFTSRRYAVVILIIIAVAVYYGTIVERPQKPDKGSVGPIEANRHVPLTTTSLTSTENREAQERTVDSNTATAEATPERTAASLWIDRVSSLTSAERRQYESRVHMRVSAAQMQRYLQEVDERKRDQLERLLSDKLMIGLDIQQAAKKSGLDPNSPAVANLRSAEREKIDSELRSLVGNTMWQDIDANIYKLPCSVYSVEFVGASFEQNVPLTQKQIEAVDLTLAQGPPSQPEDIPDPKTGLTLRDERLIEALKATLSDDQIEVLKNVRRDDNLFQAKIPKYKK